MPWAFAPEVAVASLESPAADECAEADFQNAETHQSRTSRWPAENKYEAEYQERGPEYEVHSSRLLHCALVPGMI